MTATRRIRAILLAPGNGSFFYDDQAAIRAGVTSDGFQYVGRALTPGFSKIRMPARSLSVGLDLGDGAIVWGDMMGVQYSGAGGRDPLFDVDDIANLTREVVLPRLRDCDPGDFLGACAQVFAPVAGERLPLAIEYGVSQALLAAAAHLGRKTMAEVVCEAFDLPLPDRPVPIFGQSGDAREINVDKMILKRLGALPHGLINSREKFGPEGETFRAFVRWVAKRARDLGGPDYAPRLHFDLYSWIGLEFGLDPDVLADFLARLADDAPGFRLSIEAPADYGSTAAQVEGYARLIEAMTRKGAAVEIAVDEHCNTLDDIRLFAEARAAHLIQIKMPDVGSIADSARAVLICKANGVGAYLGGSCTETDLSARASVHVAVATQADMMLSKPGMGVDEGFSIVGNEQSRLLAILARHASGAGA